MCRSKAESGRRCPCSSPARRSAADRARYAAKRAAALTAAGQTHPAPPAAGEAPTVDQIKDRIDLVQTALDTTAPSFDPNSEEGLKLYEQWQEQHRNAGEALQHWTNAADGLDAREQAVVKVGAMVSDRAEMHAGITAEEVQASWQSRRDGVREQFEAAKAITEEADAKHQAVTDELYGPRDQTGPRMMSTVSDSEAWARGERTAKAAEESLREWKAAYEEAGYYEIYAQLRLIEAGEDEQTRADLQRLSQGYRTALGEIRELGGELTWHEKTHAKAKQFFDPAAQVYPSEWITTSNQRSAPVGKITKARAHYTEGAEHVSRKKVPYTLSFHISELEDVKANYTVPQYRHEVVTGDSGSQEIVVTSMEQYSPFKHRMKNGKPTGGGWEPLTYTDYSGKETTTWWRPLTRMRQVSTTFAPEITTDGSHATSMHELAHRMEASVPQIGQMEARWVARRTTTNGVRDETEAYRPGSRREQVRPDDFIDRYIGKDYGTSTYHEVLSVGAPMLFTGDRGGMVGVGRHKRDDDMRAFVLGCLASAKAPKNINRGVTR